MKLLDIVSIILFAFATHGFGHEFAWHSWRTITRVFSFGKGIGGAFYSSLCTAAAICIWVFTESLPPLWILILCAMLTPVVFIWLRTGAFDTFRILGINYRVTSAVDDLRNDMKAKRVTADVAATQIIEWARRQTDSRLRRFMVISLSDITHLKSMYAMRRFLQDDDWKIQFAAILGIKRLGMRLGAQGIFDIKLVRGLLSDLDALLNSSNCERRLKTFGTEVRDGLQRSIQMYDNHDRSS